MYSLRDLKKHKNKDARAIIAYDGDKPLGWMLMIPTSHEPELYEALDYVTDYAKRTCKYTLQFYVRKDARRMGVAKALMEEALRYTPRPRVIPWSPESAAFFADYPVYVDRYRRYLITSAKRKKRAKVEHT